jgi:hypothetical protein
MILASFVRIRSRLIIVMTMGTALAGLLWQISPVQSDTLSPQRIQELTDLGAQIADREKAMKEAEQQLQNPNLSPADRERLTNEVGDHRDFIKNTNDTVSAQGADQKRVLDRAIEARQKQHQLREAEAKAKADPNDKKAQRTANRLKVELQNDYKDLGTLPPLASAAMPGSGAASQAAAAAILLDDCNRAILVAAQASGATPSGLLTQYPAPPDSSPLRLVRLFDRPGPPSHRAEPPVHLVNDPLPSGPRLIAAGQSGYAQVASPGSTRAEAGIKGHSRLVSTGDIKQQTNTELDLDQLAHLEEEPSETSNFAQYFGYDFKLGSWGKSNWNVGAQWSDADAKPPHVATVGQDGGFGFSDWDVSAKVCHRLHLAYGFNHASTPISPSKGTGSYDVTLNANPSYIAAFTTARIPDRFFADAMEEGAVNGSRYTWTGFYTGINEVPFIASGQVSEEGYNRLAWNPDLRNFMAYGERNPGALPDPVPGLAREDWPDNEAEIIPTLTLTGLWLEE